MRSGCGALTVKLRYSKRALAPEEPTVSRLRDQQIFGAPAERNVLVDEQVDNIFRSAGTKNLLDCWSAISTRSLRD